MPPKKKQASQSSASEHKEDEHPQHATASSESAPAPILGRRASSRDTSTPPSLPKESLSDAEAPESPRSARPKRTQPSRAKKNPVIVEADASDDAESDVKPKKRTRKQPAKRKAAPPSDAEADGDDGDEEKKKPKQPRKRAAKAAAKTVTRKKKLALIKLSAEQLKALDEVKTSTDPQPHVDCCTLCSSRELHRAVELNNAALLKKLIADKTHVASLTIGPAVHDSTSPLERAAAAKLTPLVKILEEAYAKEAGDRAPLPSNSLRQSTGSFTSQTYGFAVRKASLARGGREGNNAFAEDEADSSTGDAITATQKISESVSNAAGSEHWFYSVCAHGNRSLAASLAAELEKNGGWGLNHLHTQALSFDGSKDFDTFRANQVKKKAHQYLRCITPVHCAALNPHGKYLKALLAAGGGDAIDTFKRAPVHFAAVCSSTEPLQVLIESGAQLGAKERMGKTALHFAAKCGFVENVKLVASTDPSLIPIKSRKGAAAIHLAASAGQAGVLAALLDAGAAIDLLDSKKQTALSRAAQMGHTEAVRLLLERGANPLLGDKVKKLPLHFAAMNGRLEASRLLLQKGCPPDAADTSNNTVAHYAAAYGAMDVLKLLQAAGADLAATNDWKSTSLTLAVAKGHLRVLKFLLEQKRVDINERDGKGATLVHHTLQNKNASTLTQLKYLVEEKKADLNIVDINGVSAMHLVASPAHPGDLQIANLLAAHSANLDLRTEATKESPLLIALRAGNLPIVQWLLEKNVSVQGENVNQENLLHVLMPLASLKNIHVIFRLLQKAVPTAQLIAMAKQVNKNGLTPLLLLLSRAQAGAISPNYGYRKKTKVRAFGFGLPADEAEKEAVSELEKEFAVPLISDEAKMVQFVREFVEYLHVDLTQTVCVPKGEGAAKMETENEEGDEAESDADSGDEQPDADNAENALNFQSPYEKFTALHFAVEQSWPLSLAEFFIAKGVPVSAADHQGRTALHLCVSKRASNAELILPVVRALVAAKVAVNSQDNKGRAALHLLFASASRSDPIEIASDLCTLDVVQLNVQDKHKRTPLHFAASAGATISCMYLLARGADVNAEDADGNTPLCHALLSHKSDCAIILINKGANIQHQIVDVDSIAKTNSSSYGYHHQRARKRAFHHGDEDAQDAAAHLRKQPQSLFKFVLVKGWMGLAYLMMDQGVNAAVALRDSLNTEKFNLAHTLIQKCSDANVTSLSTDKNQNLLHVLAAYEARGEVAVKNFAAAAVSVAELLIQRRISLNHKDADGAAAVHYAARSGHTELLTLLLNKGADANARDNRKRTPLVWAVRNNQSAVVTLLLANKSKYKLDLNAVDEDGKSCVHHVVAPTAFASYENFVLLEQLHREGAALDLKDSAGKTALFYAHQQLSGVMASALIKLGSKDEKSKNDAAAMVRAKSLFYNPASHPPLRIQEDAAEERKKADATNAALLKKKPAEVVPDPLAGMEKVCKVLQTAESPNDWYDVDLHKSEVFYGAHGWNNFYKMQVIHNPIQNLYILWTKWGRLGETGQYQRTPFPSAAEAAAEFKKIFQSKTGNQWEKRTQFERKAGKYRLRDRAELEQPPKLADALEPIDLSKCPPSKLPQNVQQFLRSVVDVTAIRNSMRQNLSLDVDHLPLGSLTRKQIDEAYAILREASALVTLLEPNSQTEDDDDANIDAGDNNGDEEEKEQNEDEEEKEEGGEEKEDEEEEGGTKKDDKKKPELSKAEREAHYERLVELSSQYFTLIPCVSHRLRVLDRNQVQKQMQVLNALNDLEIASVILLAARHNSLKQSPLDYVFHSLQTEILPLDRSDDRFMSISRYAHNTREELMVDVLEVFQIARKGEAERYAPYARFNNRMLLWHGTSMSNFIGILSQGMRIAPPEAPRSGFAFGKGIYTSDALAKSMGYCRGNRTYCLLLCEVALGNIKVLEQPQYMEKPPKGFDSCVAAGRRIPDPSQFLITNDGLKYPSGALMDAPESPKPCTAYNEYIVYNESQIKLRYIVIAKDVVQ